MAARFWVGGNGTWDTTTTTNWSATSGGAGGATTPTSADAVTFDSLSGAGTVTTNTGAVCLSLTESGSSGLSLSPGTSTTATVFGSVSIGSSNFTYGGGTLSMTASGTWVSAARVSLDIASGVTGTMSGSQNLLNLTVDSGATLSSTANLTITGDVNINGTAVMSISSGTWTFTGATFQISATSTGSFAASVDMRDNTGTIVTISRGFTGAILVGATGSTNNLVIFQGATSVGGGLQCLHTTGATGTTTIKFGAGVVTTLTDGGAGSLLVTGYEPGNKLNLQSGTPGSSATLTLSPATTIKAHFSSVRDINVTGANLNCFDSVSISNNTGLIFFPPLAPLFFAAAGG